MTDIQFTSDSSKASIWQQQWQSSGLTQKAYCQIVPLWRMTCYDLNIDVL
jgi:hypothetical protein